MPGPPDESTVTTTHAPDRRADSADIDWTTEQVNSVRRHDSYTSRVSIMPARPGVRIDDDGRRIDTRRWINRQLSIVHQPAPARSVCATHDRIGQGRQTTIREPPLQALRKRRGSPGCIAKPQSRRRQSQPDLTDVVLATELREQGCRPYVVLADCCRSQSQCHGWIARRHSVSPIQPAQRRNPVTASGGSPTPLECLECQRRGIRNQLRRSCHVQRAAACGSALSVSIGAGGRVARSARASCSPCASARSLQTRARSKSRSPASPRAR